MPSNSVLTGLFVLLALGAAGLLVLGIRALVNVSSGNQLAELPARPVQTVSLAGPAQVVLALRGKQFQTGFGGVAFTLKDARTGLAVDSEAIVVRTQSSSLTGIVTLSVRRFAVPHAGDYVLEAQGLAPGMADSEARFVLQRPHGMRLVGHILWVVGAAVLLLASIVAAVLLGNAPSGRP